MSDVLRVRNQFYVRATSGLADDRTRVLKYGDTLAVCNRFGDIEALGNRQFGLFHTESRHLSRFVLTISHRQPLLLGSTIHGENAFLVVDLTNLDLVQDGVMTLPKETLHLFRHLFVDGSSLYQQLRILNYGLKPAEFSLILEFGADFADIFEVRGTARNQRGTLDKPERKADSVVFSYHGLDSVLRRTRISFSPQPEVLSIRAARYDLSLSSKQEVTIVTVVSCERNDRRSVCLSFPEAKEKVAKQATRHETDTEIVTSSERFNGWLDRSGADLRMLMNGNPEGEYPYAGVPWFNTIFGRDGIITALECLWILPSIAVSVLEFLAQTQATRHIPKQDAQPGKILHELRNGEMATLGEVPFGRYYGSVDATPLFIILAAGYFLRTADLSFIKKIWPNIRNAMNWIDRNGDIDGDGFVEYSSESPDGLVQQGWKDSHDSVFHADGRLARPPIALCEVQAYVYAARRSAAFLGRALGFAEESEAQEKKALALQTKFREKFWCEELGVYALALDGNKERCCVRASNSGHTLFGGIASGEHAERISQTLFTNQFFSGWGIRTVSADEVRYNPMSYHNGSVWPHDNALIALGLSLYGFQERAARILYGLYEASLQMDLRRMPELFCGFHKRPDDSGPTLYPVACSPQAWSAGAVYLLLRACLGLTIRAREQQIQFQNPYLPPNLDEVRIRNLRVRDSTVNLLVKRHAYGIGVDVLEKTGNVEVVKSV